jgi:hypothetical protein
MALSNSNWKNDFFKFLMTEQDERAFDLKYQHFPTSFYRYRTLSDKTIENIENNDVWLASIESLNDPFECSLKFDNNACLRLLYGSTTFQNNFSLINGVRLSQKDIEKLSKSHKPYIDYIEVCKFYGITINVTPEEQFAKIQNRWNEILKETNDQLRVCCFSEYNDSILMWSHYADNHKGFCIEYDLQNEDNLRPFLLPIIYSSELFSIQIFEELSSVKKIGSTLIKSKEWEYESEWRLVIFNRPLNLPEKIKVPNPKAVYLGERFAQNKEADKERLLKTLKSKNIPIYAMTKHPAEYKLVNVAI